MIKTYVLIVDVIIATNKKNGELHYIPNHYFVLLARKQDKSMYKLHWTLQSVFLLYMEVQHETTTWNHEDYEDVPEINEN